MEWHQPSIFMLTETRIDGQCADDIIKRLSFDRAYYIETIGYVGGIWLLWRSNVVDMDILSATKQEIHVIV